MKLKVFLVLFLTFIFSIYSYTQPFYDDQCDPKDINVCVFESGTTFGATVDQNFIPSGNCYDASQPGVFFEFVPSYEEPYAIVEISNLVGSTDVTLLFGKWTLGCEDQYFQVYGEYCGPSNQASIAIAGLVQNEVYTVFVSTPSSQPATFSVSICPNEMIVCDNNTNCDNAISLGQLEGPTSICKTGCNIGAPNNFQLGDCDHEGVVWFSFSTSSNMTSLNNAYISVATTDLVVPIYQVFNGTCGALNPLDICQNGNQNGLYSIPIVPNETYYIGVSSFFVESEHFDICVTNFGSGSKCAIDLSISPTATSLGSPLSGPFQPCEEVSFCMNVNEYTAVSNGCQWLQGVIPIFGNGWDVSSFGPEQEPINIDEEIMTLYNGTWDWYTDITYNTSVTSKTIGDFDNDGVLEMCHYTESDCANTGIVANQIMPPGWYAWDPADPDNNDGHPNNDWGDGPGCGPGHGPWEVCFTLMARCDNDCVPDDCLDASVKFYTTSDGETGTWSGGISTCAQDEPAIFQATVIPDNMIDNTIVYEEEDQYLKIINSGSNFDFLNWEIPGESKFQTDNNELFLISTENGSKQVQLNVSDGYVVNENVEEIIVNSFPIPEVSIDQSSNLCPGENIIIHNTTDAESISASWTIIGGTILFENQDYVEVSFDSPGIYSVELEMVDSDGNLLEGSFSNFIEINSGPDAVFSYEIFNNEIVLTNESSNYSEISWFINSELAGVGEEVYTYSFVENGLFEITLEVSNHCNSESTNQIVSFFGFPEVSTSNYFYTLCPGDSQFFTHNSLDNLDSLTWEFSGDVSPPLSGDEVTVTFEEPGDYQVLLTGYNTLGTDQLTIFVEVTDESMATFDYEINGLEIVIDNTSENYESSTWVINEIDTLFSDSVSLELVNNDPILVELIINSSCASDTISSEIIIDIFPELYSGYDTIQICVGSDYIFSLDSMINVDSLHWEFSEGEPNESDSSSVIITYNAEGYYSYSVTGYNQFGNDNIGGVIHVINPAAAIANFNFEIDGYYLLFQNTSQNFNQEIWIFNSVDTFYTDSIEIEITQNEVIEVALIAENICTSDTIVSEVIIDVFPTLLYSNDTINICLGDVYTFSLDFQGNIDSVNWVFPDGNPMMSDSLYVDVEYEEIGTYDYSLFGFNEYGIDSITGTVIVTEGAVPEASFTHVIEGTELLIENTSLNFDNHFWIINYEDTVSTENLSINLIENGVFNIQLVVENICSESIEMTEILIDFFPELLFNQDSIFLCAGDSYLFELTDIGNIDSIKWEFEGGFPSESTDEEIMVEFSEIGTYNFSLTGYNEFGFDTFGGIIYVQPAVMPIANFNIEFEANKVNITNTAENFESICWIIDDETIEGDLDSLTWIFQENGTYSIIQIAKNLCGSDTLIFDVSIENIPEAYLDSDYNYGCQPLEVNFSDLSTGALEERVWTFEGGIPATSTDSIVTVLYADDGNYDVMLVVKNSFGTDTAFFEDFIYVAGLPIISFSYEESTGQFTANITNGNVVLWKFGDGYESGETNPIHFYEHTGQYEVTLIAENSECQDSLVGQLDVIANLDESENFRRLSINPNPVSSNQIYVELFSSSAAESIWQIRDIHGRIINSGKLELSKSEFTIDAPTDSGIYFLTVKDKNGSFTEKFIVVY